MEIHGIPLHPLVLHAAVVLGPLAALISLLYVGYSRWRVKLQAPAALLAVVGSGAIFAAWYTGRMLLHDRHYLVEGDTPVARLVHSHQHRANILAIVSIAYVVLAIGAWLTRGLPSGRIVRPLLGLTAMAVLVLVVLVGDVGARAVWV